MGCTLVLQTKGVSSILAHRSISIASRLLRNGYSPIYFTNEALIFYKIAPRECYLFL